MRSPDQYAYLPLFAKCAVECLDAQGDRSIAKLDAYLTHYATSMGQQVDEHSRFSAHAIAILRFAPETMDRTGSVAAWEGDSRPSLNNATYQPITSQPIPQGQQS